MLWPEKRKGDRMFITASGKPLPGVVDVTSATSYLRVPKGYLPDFLQPLAGPLTYAQPWLFKEGGVEIGPIPKGTPVNLLSNIDLEQRSKLLAFLVRAKADLKSLPSNATDAAARAAFTDLVKPLLAISKCPDFVVNRGHYFGTEYFAEEQPLTDADRRALVAFLKTL
jgi:hypothetical protein